MLWDVPRSQMHAVSDVGAMVEWLQDHICFGHESKDNLAVLHNQNDMVRGFGMSAWVSQSQQKVISRSVTSCAGMVFLISWQISSKKLDFHFEHAYFVTGARTVLGIVVLMLVISWRIS